MQKAFFFISSQPIICDVYPEKINVTFNFTMHLLLGEVLMMQEAKSTCAGQWYLPAGRMEPGEDIAEAAQREVLEETGLHFQITTLLMVESAGGSGFRFVVTGEVTGGRLKTPADADKESLQAKWISDLGELSLRANDVLTLVEKGRQYYAK